MRYDFSVEVEAEQAAGTFTLLGAAARLASQMRISLEDAVLQAIEIYLGRPRPSVHEEHPASRESRQILSG